MDFDILFLDYKLKIFCAKELDDSDLLNLTKLLINNSCKFITYTKSVSEVSIIIEESYLKNFSDKVVVDPVDYNILQIYENTSGCGHIGIVSHISNLFSQNSIPILYLNTFNNNYILYPSELNYKIRTILNLT